MTELIGRSNIYYKFIMGQLGHYALLKRKYQKASSRQFRITTVLYCIVIFFLMQKNFMGDHLNAHPEMF